MTPTASSEAASRAYDTRLKGRLQNVQKKYDDIFSAVFKKTSSTEFITAIPSFRRRPDIHYFDGDRKRSTSSSESIGTSDSGHETDSNGSQSPTFEDIEIVEINHKEEPKVENAQAIPKHKCECGSLFVKHHQLHEHIHMKHSFARLFRCTTCSITIKGIRNNYVCRICKQFVAANMDSHLRDHYQDRKGDNAFMECRCCYKSFKTVEEVRAHERRVHFAHRQILTQWPCEYCPKVFNTRHNRDAHLVGHVSNSVGGIWEKITQMQELLTDQTLVNQCPICDSVMGSRKSFRLHIIHKHLLRDTTHFISSMGLPNVSAVLQAMRDNARITDKPVKSEVKGEITSESTMDDQMEIKTEPVE